VKAEWDTTPPRDRPTDICVDAVGLGAGVADRLSQLQLPVRPINVAEVASTAPDQYANLRSELWYAAKAWFARMDCAIPEDQPNTLDGTLGEELARVRYRFQNRGGRLVVESKSDIKRRGYPSPDLADAFVLTFAASAAQLLHGVSSSSWSQPLRRNLKGVV
jgi:hypothetical protein